MPVGVAGTTRAYTVMKDRRADLPDGHAPDTARLIAACRAGDREAFRQLFECYKDRAYSIALHFLGGDTAAAEDVTQEVFVRLFTRIGQFHGNADFGTWLYRLVANACVDEQRRRRRLVSWGDREERSDGGTELPDDERLHLQLDVVPSIQAALAALPPALRSTILLRYFDELSYDEMARTLACSPGTVASRLHRGLKILSRKLAHLRPQPAAGEEECSPST